MEVTLKGVPNHQIHQRKSSFYAPQRVLAKRLGRELLSQYRHWPPTNGCGSSHSGYQFYVLTRCKKTSLWQTLRFNDFDPQILSDLVFRFSQSMLPVLYISISWYVLIVCSMIYQNPKIVFLHPDLIYIFFLFFLCQMYLHYRFLGKNI